MVRFAEAYDEIEGLVQEHAGELNATLAYKVDPDRELYEAHEKANTLRMFLARDEALAVGYATYFIGPHPQTRGELRAIQDAIYLHPAWRRGNVGMDFIRYCDDCLKADGAALVIQAVHPSRDFGPVLERLGYVELERLWGRRL
jgi:GNAT superfamily N-acetyltransferase